MDIYVIIFLKYSMFLPVSIIVLLYWMIMKQSPLSAVYSNNFAYLFTIGGSFLFAYAFNTFEEICGYKKLVSSVRKKLS